MDQKQKPSMFDVCCIDDRVKTRQNPVNNEQRSSTQTTSSTKQDVGKSKKKLNTKTTNKKKPTVIVRRKSLSLAWSQQTYVRRYRSRCRQHRYAGVAQKRRQTKAGCDGTLESVRPASNCSSEPAASVDCRSPTAAEENKDVTIVECVSEPVMSAECVDNATTTVEEAETHQMKDDSITEPVTADESTDNILAGTEETDLAVNVEQYVSRPEMTAQCVNNTATTTHDVDLESAHETNSAEERLVEIASAAIVLETTDVSPSAAGLSSKTADVVSSVSQVVSSSAASVTSSPAGLVVSSTNFYHSVCNIVIVFFSRPRIVASVLLMLF